MGQAFAAGAPLVLAREEEFLPGSGFAALLRERGVTHVTLPLRPRRPPARRALGAGNAGGGGAGVRGGAGGALGEGRRFVNAYGPTEATVCVTMGDCAAGEAVNIGRALPGVRSYVVAKGGEWRHPARRGSCAGQRPSRSTSRPLHRARSRPRPGRSQSH